MPFNVTEIYAASVTPRNYVVFETVPHGVIAAAYLLGRVVGGKATDRPRHRVDSGGGDGGDGGGGSIAAAVGLVCARLAGDRPTFFRRPPVKLSGRTRLKATGGRIADGGDKSTSTRELPASRKRHVASASRRRVGTFGRDT